MLNMEKKTKPSGQLEENLILIPLGISFGLTLLGFICKVFGAKELAEAVIKGSYYSYAWCCFLCLGCCARDNRYLRLSLLHKKYPAPLRKLWIIINGLLGFAISAALLIGTLMVIRNYLGGEEANKMVVFTYVAPVVGFGLGLFRMVQRKLKDDRAKKGEDKL